MEFDWTSSKGQYKVPLMINCKIFSTAEPFESIISRACPVLFFFFLNLRGSGLKYVEEKMPNSTFEPEDKNFAKREKMRGWGGQGGSCVHL